MKFQFDAGVAANRGGGFGAGRAARPVFARLIARLLIGRKEGLVDFVGRAAVQGRVRSVCVVPTDERQQGTTKGLASEGDE